MAITLLGKKTRERPRQPLQRGGLLLLLKTFQRLGYFALCAWQWAFSSRMFSFRQYTQDASDDYARGHNQKSKHAATNMRSVSRLSPT
jgi:hypothetical protein